MIDTKEYELGRIVAAVEALDRAVSKLDVKLDQIVNTQVHRRELDALSERLTELERLARANGVRIASSAWIERAVSATIAAGVSGGVAYLFK